MQRSLSTISDTCTVLQYENSMTFRVIASRGHEHHCHKKMPGLNDELCDK